MTGAVVDRAVAALPPDGVIVDIGTGCGAIAFAIAAERPDVQVLASDISDEALKWAAENRLRTGLEVGFFLGDLFEPFPVDVRGRVDVVVSNPPHVPAGAGSSLPRDVVDHEPGVALFAGPDGLSIINRIAAEATNWLRPGGWLVSELGDSQGEDVTRHLDSLGYSDIAVHLDDASRRRVIEAQWKEVGRRL
ncbi:MAG: release factor glutamine methyltransferase [Actinomycetota bacterium]|nr:release factor glutamine methyltransferase [Actinomycetota bacterium]